MLDKKNIDLKIILSFVNAYEKLYEKGEISSKQLDEVLSLLDNYQIYDPEEFEKKLNEIFS
ncbi:hypothetical protein [Halothermothrix orenii]|uniref:Uncharacterized protein n=1 Tax=Halothermothrix orenii (strain H 168 / OCM 544 / DSM 9562) TaxID=373903 RepID=B8D1A8_HALOH|nr:hypothetical protein [Halothermothrix orenii]ACL71060.1 hypothetical protein Hore_23150 [Halothermothrix orenii H 168]